MNQKRKFLSLLLAAALLLGILSGCGEKNAPAAEPETVVFTDSVGREVEVPREITRIAPSGAVATMFLAVAATEYMVCVNQTPSDTQMTYLDARLADLPATGQLYGSKSTLNLEQLIATDAQVIIDFGDAKEGIEDDLNALQEQCGIPVVFIESDLDSMEEAFELLGTLLPEKEARCTELSEYVHETLAIAQENDAKITDAERLSVMYTSGESGLDTNAKGSTQAQVIEVVGAENAIVVDDVSNKGGGNTINIEQLYLFNPDVILFSSGSIYAQAADEPAWQQLDAIQNGTYCEIPSAPYNWMANPPSLNMLLGIRWLGNLLYPELYDYDMVAETQRAYKLLWNYELSETDARAMLANAVLQ